MLLFFLAAALVSILVLRGDIRRIGHIELKRLGWILASFILRDLAEEFLRMKEPSVIVLEATAFACYGMLFYGLWPNLRLPGIWMATAGSFLNFAVIVVNNGRMPVSIKLFDEPLQAAEVARLATSVTHQLLVPETRLGFLADVFKWSFLQMKPMMFSLGDLLIDLGIVWLLLRACIGPFPASKNNGRID